MPSRSTMKPFAITSLQNGSGAWEIAVSGELDLAVADQLKAALDDVTSEGAEVLVLLGDCEFIDSTGVALLVRARRSLAERNGELLLCEPVDQVRNVLSVSGLLEPSFVADSIDDARARSSSR
jgi:anti-anti-sigma factor